MIRYLGEHGAVCSDATSASLRRGSLGKKNDAAEDAVCAGPDDGYLKGTATHYKFKSLDQCKHTMALMFMQGYYKVTTKRHSHTHTDTASTPPFLRFSLFSCLSAVSLSAVFS